MADWFESHAANAGPKGGDIFPPLWKRLEAIDGRGDGSGLPAPFQKKPTVISSGNTPPSKRVERELERVRREDENRRLESSTPAAAVETDDVKGLRPW